jgi:hypothetical protein
LSRREEMYIARDYLTVEVTLHPAKDPSGEAKPFDVNLGEFWLAVNYESTSMADSPYAWRRNSITLIGNRARPLESHWRSGTVSANG